VPIFTARLPNGTMRVTVAPPVVPEKTTDLDATAAHLTAVLTAHIERQIREFPEQWVWLHKRWRHQPGDGDLVWRADVLPS